MRVSVLAFARVREILGRAEHDVELPEGARIRDAWTVLVTKNPALASIAASTRFALNGHVVREDAELRAGDELALLPPSGGG